MDESASQPMSFLAYQNLFAFAGPFPARAEDVLRPRSVDFDAQFLHTTSMETKIVPPSRGQQSAQESHRRQVAKRHHADTRTKVDITDNSLRNYSGTSAETTFLDIDCLFSSLLAHLLAPWLSNAATETLITPRSDHSASRLLFPTLSLAESPCRSTVGIKPIQVVLLSEAEVWSEVVDPATQIQVIKERLSVLVAIPVDRLQLWPDSVLGQDPSSRDLAKVYTPFEDDDLVFPGMRLVLYKTPHPDDVLCWQLESMVLRDQSGPHLVEEPRKKRSRA